MVDISGDGLSLLEFLLLVEDWVGGFGLFYLGVVGLDLGDQLEDVGFLLEMRLLRRLRLLRGWLLRRLLFGFDSNWFRLVFRNDNGIMNRSNLCYRLEHLYAVSQLDNTCRWSSRLLLLHRLL